MNDGRRVYTNKRLSLERNSWAVWWVRRADVTQPLRTRRQEEEMNTLEYEKEGEGADDQDDRHGQSDDQ